MAIESNTITKMTKTEAILKMKDFWNILSTKEQDFLLDKMIISHFKKNQPIYSEGEAPQFMMCLLSGKVKVFKNGVGERNQIVRVIKPYQYFAYRAYFAKENFVTNATAFENAWICQIPMKDIEQVTAHNNKLAMHFINLLSVDLGISDKRSVSLLQNNIRGRLAETLLFLKDNYGLEEDGFTLSIYLSREDLAGLSNMTTANAIRTLSNFAAEKLIATDGRKIKIIKELELLQIAKI